MRITRIYATADGESHFGDFEVDLEAVDPHGRSAPIGALGWFVLQADGLQESWHVAPRRQLAFLSQGTVDFEVSDGEVRRVNPGEILWIEDVTGKGHISRFPFGGRRVFVNIPLRHSADGSTEAPGASPG